MSDGQQNAKPDTILDDPALALKAAKQEGMEGEPTLRPAYYENNPRLVVKTKVPNDKNNGKIEAALSNQAFFAVMRAVEAVANSKEPCVIMMDNKGHRFVDKKRDPNPSIMSSIKIERSNEGVVSICISAGKNRPLIEFPFLDTTYHNFRDGSGAAMGVAVASRLFALAWVDVMREYMGKTIERHYKRPAWMDRNNQQGGGGGNSNWGNRQQGGGQQGGNNNWGNRGQQGGGSYGQQGSSSAQSSQSDNFNFDDDVPL